MTVIPYGSTWRTLEIASGSSGPANWEQPSFDDSAWSLAAAPFGFASSLCPIFAINPPVTAWTPGTDRLYRMVASFGGNVTFKGAIDNDIALWVDGDVVLPRQNHENCAFYDNWSVTTAMASGSHLVAVRTYDRGDVCFFDLACVGIGGGWAVGMVRMGA